MMKVLWKQLLQPHIDYCSQLYYQGRGLELTQLESLQRTFTRSIKEVQALNYWERLKHLGLKSQERRIERYRIIYTWKCLEGLVPDCGIKSRHSERLGRSCEVEEICRKSSQRIQTLKEKSFKIDGPRLFNAMPKHMRNQTRCTVDEFKFKLDHSLQDVPDQPRTPNLEPTAMNQ